MLKAKEGVDAAVKYSRKKTPGGKGFATDYLGKLNDQSLVEPIIQVLLTSKGGRPRAHRIGEVLKKIPALIAGCKARLGMNG